MIITKSPFTQSQIIIITKSPFTKSQIIVTQLNKKTLKSRDLTGLLLWVGLLNFYISKDYTHSKYKGLVENRLSKSANFLNQFTPLPLLIRIWN